MGHNTVEDHLGEMSILVTLLILPYHSIVKYSAYAKHSKQSIYYTDNLLLSETAGVVPHDKTL